MVKKLLTLTLALSVVAQSGCKRSAPPAAPVAVAPPPEPPPPPPPPKCESLDEACVAAPETRSRIQDSSWTLAPPPTWTYAHDSDATVARTATASLGVLVHETGAKKAQATKRAAALEAITRKLGLTMGRKRWPAAPAKVLSLEGLKVSLYQFDGVKQEGKPGALLVFTSTLPAGQSLLGVGFVLEADTTDADQAIMKSVQSLRVEAREGGDAGASAK